ncbi:embryogenesis-associated protein EMB8 [Thalictrum thalictroides]|uniref:Embryogenesis-associated protein EMB8 n=1 Tax=Thalictrum thalictroides TaxID=46969 RepID=A0A7J6VAI5_THATH|nr:embryogenesis-associated protein EMB8 [Thalictrum thalictroides]
MVGGDECKWETWIRNVHKAPTSGIQNHRVEKAQYWQEKGDCTRKLNDALNMEDGSGAPEQNSSLLEMEKDSLSVRDFDKNATCILGKFETADTYYRQCSSAGYVKNIAVPLLCISALDDPVCTREAIPWDECRANKNIVLATTPHGGHLAFFEGITAHCLW